MSVFWFALDNQLPPGFESAHGTVVCLDITELKNHKPMPGDLSYLNIAGQDGNEQRKTMLAIRRRCGQTAWGIADPAGDLDDPAKVFFMGACDYLGPKVFKQGVDKARTRDVRAYTQLRPACDTARPPEAAPSPVAVTAAAEAEAFCGWKVVKPGVTYPFHFLFIAASAQMNLKTRLGESGYIAFRDRLRAQIQQVLAEADPLLWMETDATAIYLIPSTTRTGMNVVIACLRLLLGTPIFGYERLGLSFPIEFTCALHHGSTEFAVPGKTGTIISDAVNFIFHLGAKCAQPGRLTISSDVDKSVIPAPLRELFVDAGEFEGRSIMHSRRFGAI